MPGGGGARVVMGYNTHRHQWNSYDNNEGGGPEKINRRNKVYH